ncbi:MAG: hypothetical protein NTX97_14920 [Bacteroidetes bacterium]|nr:hypothetical protein [Bacteroidota bacterium]
MANPESKYRISDNTLYTATDKVGIKAILLKLPEAISLNDNNMNIGFCPVNLWIGIDASINWAGSLYFNIPDSMRPSPLNFIFKDLTKENRKLDFKNVRFNAFDFDAY